METTYDVKIYKILTYKGARKSTYTVRWMVAGKRWREPFGTVALAEGFRSELITATGKGEAFVIATGLPVSHRSKSAAMLVQVRHRVRGRALGPTRRQQPEEPRQDPDHDHCGPLARQARSVRTGCGAYRPA
ncbi:hypothetical protein [Streptomyces sp. NPDC047453]|uniref:hypothetical protein n=1 Tax=Streptomyces sp. NPDC047453 TaxID=3154812 RepID=UPI0033CBC16F